MENSPSCLIVDGIVKLLSACRCAEVRTSKIRAECVRTGHAKSANRSTSPPEQHPLQISVAIFSIAVAMPHAHPHPQSVVCESTNGRSLSRCATESCRLGASQYFLQNHHTLVPAAHRGPYLAYWSAFAVWIRSEGACIASGSVRRERTGWGRPGIQGSAKLPH